MHDFVALLGMVEESMNGSASSSAGTVLQNASSIVDMYNSAAAIRAVLLEVSTHFGDVAFLMSISFIAYYS